MLQFKDAVDLESCINSSQTRVIYTRSGSVYWSSQSPRHLVHVNVYLSEVSRDVELVTLCHRESDSPLKPLFFSNMMQHAIVKTQVCRSNTLCYVVPKMLCSTS